VLRGQLADDLLGRGVQRGEQVDRAVPHVVEAAPLRHPGQHRQHRRGPLKRLDLWLLIHREHRGVRRRREIQADPVADLSISKGSGEMLKSSVRQGCRPNARQIRSTLEGEIPTRFASSRFDQCVAPWGNSSRVRTTTSSTWASVMVRGTPGRGSSARPSSRSRRNRARQRLTVLRLTSSRAETAVLLPPSAQASTIRARSASPCAVVRRFAQPCYVSRSTI
jgi:hypothetical protein